MINRRQFLSGCSTLVLASTVSPTVMSAASLRRDSDVKQPGFDAFSECVNSTFVVERETGRSVALELVKARQQPKCPVSKANALDSNHEKFSLLFRGPCSEALDQNTYTFQHEQLGRIEIFIVPVGVKDPGHEYYQAIFNRPAA
jgi:hypothetical protein